MSCDPQTTITIEDLNNLNTNTKVFNEVVTSPLDQTPTQASDGENKLTLNGALKRLGYQPPVVYAAGITFTSNSDNTKTIERNGIVYAPLPSQIPFTTSGTWAGDDENKFFVVQGITIDSLPALTDLVFDTVSDAQASSDISLGNKIRIVSRNNSDFLVTNDTPNGFDKIDLGSGLTATLIVTPSTTISSFGTINQADDTSLFQAAINGSNGNLIIDGQVNYTTVSTNQNLKITGLGAVGINGNAKLNQISETLDGVVASGPSISLHVEHVELTSSVSKTAGAYIKTVTGANSTIESCTFRGHYRGIAIDDSLAATIKNNFFVDAVPSSVASGSAHIVLAETSRNDTATITENFSFQLNEVDQPSFGVLVYYQDVMFAADNNFIKSGTVFAIVPKSGQVASLLFITSGEMDTSVNGVLVAPEAGGSVSRLTIHPKWIGVMSGEGVRIDGTNGNISGVMIGGEVVISGITGNGVSCFGNNVDDLQIDNANISNSAIGVRVVDTATKLRISNSVVGPVSGANPNVDGVVIGPNVSGALTCNDFSGNTGTNLSNNSPNVTEFGNKPYDWSVYTPTVASTAGAITSYTAAGRFRVEGDITHFQVSVNITDNGSGSGRLNISLPRATSSSTVISGRGAAISNKMLQAICQGSLAITSTFDGAYPAATGENVIISGSYES